MKRIVGFDFARALAILGMIIVNYKIAMGAEDAGPDWLVALTGLLEGRAAATFVVLAGVGLSLFSRRARETGDPQALTQARNTLFKRAGFLFVIGLLFATVWPADILHFYGVYLAIGALLLTAPSRRLWRVALGCVLAALLLVLFLDYEQGWDWDNYDYVDFWQPAGMLRHVFFNGYHPVLPWIAFLLAGMWVGRQEVRDPVVQRRLLRWGLYAMVTGEVLSALLIGVFRPYGDVDVVNALFGTRPMPPLPLYVLSAGGVALVVISLSLMFTERHREARWLTPFVSMGQLALTMYIAHVLIGLGVLEAFGVLEGHTLGFAVSSSLGFYTLAVWFAYLWRQRYQRGPLEWVMRAVA